MGRILINIALNLFPYKLYNRDGFYKFVYIALAKWPPPAAKARNNCTQSDIPGITKNNYTKKKFVEFNQFFELPLSEEVSGKQRYIFVLGPDLVKGQ